MFMAKKNGTPGYQKEENKITYISTTQMEVNHLEHFRVNVPREAILALPFCPHWLGHKHMFTTKAF